MSEHPNTAEVRRWAEVKGLPVDRTGKLPFGLIKAWDRAHPERPFVQAESYHGTPQGYYTYGCSCERCEEFAQVYNRDYYYGHKQDA